MEISTNMDGWINLKKHWLFDDNILGFVADAHDLWLRENESIAVAKLHQALDDWIDVQVFFKLGIPFWNLLQHWNI